MIRSKASAISLLAHTHKPPFLWVVMLRIILDYFRHRHVARGRLHRSRLLKSQQRLSAFSPLRRIASHYHHCQLHALSDYLSRLPRLLIDDVTDDAAALRCLSASAASFSHYHWFTRYSLRLCEYLHAAAARQHI